MMSWLGFTGMSRRGDGNFWGRIFSQRRPAAARKRGFDKRNCRTLRIDELEKRCLLSVTPATLSAVIVNETFAGQTTDTAHSIATDNSGDFVVAWTRDTPILDAAGNPVISPTTGARRSDF